MKRWAAVLVGCLGVVLLLHNLGQASPLAGRPAPSERRVEANTRTAILKNEIFKGGERACVIVEGDHKPVINLVLEVRDAENKLVARDNAGGDICAVIWYPPRTGAYTIWLENKQNDYNIITLVVQ
jgi:hypothetical protein